MNLTIAALGARIPHLILTVSIALAVCAIVALLGKRTARERLFHAGYLAACCVGSVVAGSWIMYLVHG